MQRGGKKREGRRKVKEETEERREGRRNKREREEREERGTGENEGRKKKKWMRVEKKRS